MIEMEAESSLAGIVNQESKGSGLKGLINRPEIRPFVEDLKSLFRQVKNEAKSLPKLLPYEAPASFLALYGGTRLGEYISRMFPVPPNILYKDFGQKFQDYEYGLVVGVILAVLADIATQRAGKYLNQRLGGYRQKHYQGNVNA